MEDIVGPTMKGSIVKPTPNPVKELARIVEVLREADGHLVSLVRIDSEKVRGDELVVIDRANGKIIMIF